MIRLTLPKLSGLALGLALAMSCGAPAPKPNPPATPEPAAPSTEPGTPAPASGPSWSKDVAWERAPEPGPEPSFAPPSAVEFFLANQVRVLLVENRRLPLVSIRVVNHRAGSREDGSKLGLAAMTADLLDEGAGKYNAETLPEALERLGASLAVRAEEDVSTLSLDLLASTLPDGIALLADVLIRPAFANADVTRIKGDRLAELARRTDSPRRVAGLVFDRVTFGLHPYAHPGDGFTPTVKRLTRGDVRRFWQTQYAPSVTTVVVAGDVDRATLEPLLAKHLGAWKGQPPRVNKDVLTPHEGRRIVVVDRKDAPQTVIIVGRLAVGWNDPRHAAAEVINTAIGGSFAARLNNRLREQLGYTYGAFSGFWRGRSGGAWSMVSSIKTGNTVDAVKEAFAILELARSQDLPAAELDKAKQLMIRGQPSEFETVAGIASSFQRLAIAGLPLDWYATLPSRIRSVDATSARAAAHDFWRDLDVIVVGDWSVVGSGLNALGIPVSRVDADGNPVGSP